MPARVGRSPLKNPRTPWASKIRRPMAMGFPPAAASSPVQAEDDWSCVRITSRGFVTQDATVSTNRGMRIGCPNCFRRWPHLWMLCRSHPLYSETIMYFISLPT